MKKEIINSIKRFHNNEIDLDQLTDLLLAANPHSSSVLRSFYNEWIHDNINAYKAGETYVLSLTSSGGIIESLNN